jgi:hypothetical protein
MRMLILIAFATACGGPAEPPVKQPEQKPTTTQTVSIVDTPRTGQPTKRVEQGMVQTRCSNGIYDCADDEICVVEHTGATLAHCAVDECPGAMSCECSADACPGMQCDEADAMHRTLTCSSFNGGAP